MKTENKFVAYYRVSSQKQGSTGLGLDAQRASVESFIKHNGNIIVAEFVEVESGRKNHRPQLEKAIEYAKLNKCTLVVSRLDRLSRNLHFISSLMESKVDFVCADLPELNTLTAGIFASLAQYESELISSRTKAALAQVKARGGKLGTPGNLKPEHIAFGRIMKKRLARENRANRQAYHFASKLRANGKTLREIAGLLNSEGYRTSRGNLWTAHGIRLLLIMFSDGSGDSNITTAK